MSVPTGLSQVERTVLDLFANSGQRPHQIAADLQIPASTARHILHHACGFDPGRALRILNGQPEPEPEVVELPEPEPAPEPGLDDLDEFEPELAPVLLSSSRPKRRRARRTRTRVEPEPVAEPEIPSVDWTDLIEIGLTYRQLDYWTRIGLVEPSRRAEGSGTQRMWSHDDLARVARVFVASKLQSGSLADMLDRLDELLPVPA